MLVRIRGWLLEQAAIQRAAGNPGMIADWLGVAAGNVEAAAARAGAEVPGRVRPPVISGPAPKPARSEPAAVAPAAKRKPGKDSRLADDFVVPEDWIAAGHEIRTRHNLSPANLEAEAEHFVLYWTSRSRNATKRDWRRTWLTWCMRNQRMAAPKSSPASGSYDPLDSDVWRRRITHWRDKLGADPEKWGEGWGYPPGEAGCPAPRHVLREMGYEPVESRSSMKQGRP
jgi:hypothetical protein